MGGILEFLKPKPYGYTDPRRLGKDFGPAASETLLLNSSQARIDRINHKLASMDKPLLGAETKTKKSPAATAIKNRELEPAARQRIVSADKEFKCYPEEITELYNDVLKIKFSTYVIESQKTNVRAESNLKRAKSPCAIFEFIAPNDIIETITHTWEPYESMATKVNSLAAGLIHKFSEFKNLSGGTGNISSVFTGLAGAAVDGWNSEDHTMSKWKATENTLKNIGRHLSQGTVSYSRIDMPLVYKNSERRRFEFTFQMASWGDPYKEILMPIRALQCFSSAALESPDDLASVLPPCIFEVETDNSGTGGTKLIHIKNAALTNVQPTFRGPYIDGIPTSCELHLSFQEIDPLWDKSFISPGFNSKVSSSETNTSINNTEQPGQKTKGNYVMTANPKHPANISHITGVDSYQTFNVSADRRGK